MLSKSKIATYVVFLVFLLHFRVLYLTPLSIIDRVLNPLLAVIGFMYLFTFPRLFDTRFKNWIYVFLGLMIVSILTSYIYLGQDIFSGIIGSMAFLELGSVVFAYYLMKSYRIRSFRIIALLKQFGWLLFGIYLVLFLLDVRFTFVSPFTGSSVNMTTQKLSTDLINFCSILYMGSFFYRGKSKYLLFSLVLFSANMFGDFQRFMFLTYMVTLVSGIFIFKNKSVVLQFVPYTLVVCFLGLFLFSYSDYGSALQKKIESGFTILQFDENASDEASVNVRVTQSEYALHEFYKHPILGNGNPRSSGMDEITEEHFFLSDIGLIGILYAFGLLGLVIYFFQLRWTKLIAIFNERTVGLKLFMIFILFSSVLTGYSIFHPGTFFILLLLYLFEIKYEEALRHNSFRPKNTPVHNG